MLAEILPAEVVAIEAFDDLADIALFPEEEAVLRKAVEKRRREFSTVRACARAALAGLGVPPAPILPGLRGAPRWPSSVVGSMTHCAGYRASAVAFTRDIVTLGVDAEPDDPLPKGVLDMISTPAERAWFPGAAPVIPGPRWDRLLFSAKESVYKTWFQMTQRWLGFDEAAITLDPTNGTFTARLLVPGPVLGGVRLTEFAGRWLARNGLVLTAIAVPRVSEAGEL